MSDATFFHLNKQDKAMKMHMETLPRCQCHKWLFCWAQDGSEFGAGCCLTLCLSNVTGTATQVNIFPRLLTSSLLPQSRQASKQEMRHWFLHFPMSVVWTLLSQWISNSLYHFTGCTIGRRFAVGRHYIDMQMEMQLMWRIPRRPKLQEVIN